MRILMISAEGPPLQRTGALVDVVDALPGALRDHGHEVSVVLPFYREIRENRGFKKKNTGITVDVPVGENTHVARYFEGRSVKGVQLFFISCDEFFDRPGIYGERGKPYEDNAARFIFFCKAALELARRLTPQIEILHLHDWAAALVPVFVHAQGLPFSTVLTIHHIADQGSFWGIDFQLMNLPEQFFTLAGVEFFGRLNFLKGGILYADRITTVSEHYRREILTPAGGCGLDTVLRENAHRLSAILDGVDYTRWNPASDRLLPARYDPKRLEGKQVCRETLLQQFELAAAPAGPVFGMITRVVREKGFEILVPLLDRLLWDDVRLIILGKGDPAYETALALAARKFPTRFAYQKTYDEKLAHLIEAGMDISLIPSRFEPAALNAMYNLKYGALPVARVTGGIQEIIEDYDPITDAGYGFLCYEYSSDAFWDAVKRARQIFRDQRLWNKLMMRAMARNFSWDVSAQRYEALYRELLGGADKAAA
jgi:starch synthase